MLGDAQWVAGLVSSQLFTMTVKHASRLSVIFFFIRVGHVAPCIFPAGILMGIGAV